DALAAIGNGEELDYRELNRRANQLASRLRTLGAGPEKCVGLCSAPTPDLLVGMLGILKAGAVYVPLDPGYPAERLRYMLEDSKADVLLIDAHELSRLFPEDRPPALREIVYLGADEPLGDGGTAAENTAAGIIPENLAYVMYTSGSSGTPKGVAVPHRAVMEFSRAAADKYRIGPKDRVLQFSSISTD